MPHELGQEIRDVWTDEEVPMLGLELPSNASSPFSFAERMLLKIEGERPDRPRVELTH